jgi:HKD family nuclease
VAPRSAYHLSYEVEIHAAETYGKYLAINGNDDKILEILNDEIEHSNELLNAMEIIK